MESTQDELDAAKHSSMKLMEEIIQLRKENENAFAEHEGKPVRNNLPVYGQAFGGQFSDIVLFNDAEAIDWVGMPYNLAGVAGAFAVMCSGNSMSPKYENGDILHIHPDKRIRRGHYIVVEWDEGDHRKATIGRYLNAVGNTVTVEKLNPATTVDFTFRRMFRIVGMTEAED
jgi:phage repressor protein C with HTH and peptisase S24 domain